MRYPHAILPYLRKTILFALLLWLAVSLSSCAVFIAAGAGAGAYSYFSGNLIRTYDAEYYKAVRTSSNVMKQLKFTVTGKTGDALKTVLKGKRADNTPVTIEIERVESNLTKIGVRNGLFGIAKLEASEQVHQRIGRQLPRHPAVIKKPKSASQKQIEVSGTKVKLTEKERKIPVTQTPATKTTAYDAGTTTPSSLSQNTFYIYYKNSPRGIPTTAYNTLDKVASYLLNNPNKSIKISGYTDSKGDPGDNLQISQKRADDIRNYLIEKGVTSRRVTAKGYGASNFLGSNRTENLRAINRRVVLHIH